MELDFEKIKKECPRSWGKFIKYLLQKYYDKDFGYKQYKSFVESDLLSYCFCDFVEFFDENGIEIFIEPYIIGKYPNDTIFKKITVHIIIKNYENKYFNDIDTRPEAQVEAVYKAFEIMEVTI